MDITLYNSCFLVYSSKKESDSFPEQLGKRIACLSITLLTFIFHPLKKLYILRFSILIPHHTHYTIYSLHFKEITISAISKTIFCTPATKTRFYDYIPLSERVHDHCHIRLLRYLEHSEKYYCLLSSEEVLYDKRVWLTILTTLFILSLHMQQDTAFIFHPENDIFYVSSWNNKKELKRHHETLKNGNMYINVNNYVTTGNENRDATQISYLRNSWIKSELIVQHRITELMSLSDKHISPYGRDNPTQCAIITFPATLKKVEQITGEEIANKIRAYYNSKNQRHLKWQFAYK